VATSRDATSSEQKQLEAWWSSLDDEQKQAVLNADLDDIPGWIIASLVAASVELVNDPATEPAAGITTHAPQILCAFITEQRGQ